MHMVAAILLIISNVFMTFAWYWHLKNPALKTAPMWIVILASWGIAFLEYCFQVPGNRLGYRAGLSASQLKVMQEAITLVVFCVFARVVLGERITWNYYVGFALVMLGVFFVFHFRTESPAAATAEQGRVTAPDEVRTLSAASALER
jgi:uncharacterized protein (DUF486 family)